MEWLQRLNESVNYIEEHLDGTIELGQAAQIACCSTFHYQRMFSYIAGIPLSEYIRRRRMTAAAFDLITNHMRVIDAALKYGYESPTAFTRAFQSVHGVSPSFARNEGVSLRAYPRISFSITIKGDVGMNYRIENKDAFRIVGVRKTMTLDVEQNFSEVPLFWQKNNESGMTQKIIGLINQPPSGLLGVCTSMNNKTFDYYIAAPTDSPVLEGMEEYTVPVCTWAVFESIGPMPSALQELQKRIVTEWLPASGYEYADAPDIELYPEGDLQSPDYRCEAWLPVVKKK